MNIGTAGGGGITRVGARGFFMVASHVGHDCDVGDDVTFANNAVLGGHVTIGNNVFLGGNSAVHQFVRIGEGVMVGGLSGAAASIVPFGFAKGQIATLDGVNVVGLRRRGTSRAELHRLRQAYRTLFHGEGVFAERIDKVAAAFADDPLVQKVIAFVRASGKRPLMHPPASRTAGDSEADGL
jgi:UDP-N-acetylglucosamine acyltransferase